MAATAPSASTGIGAFMSAHPTLGSIYTAGNAAAHSPYAGQALGVAKNYYDSGKEQEQADYDARMAYWLQSQQNRQAQGFAFGGMAGAWGGGPGSKKIRRGMAQPFGAAGGATQQHLPFTSGGGSHGSGEGVRNGQWYDKNGFSGTFNPNSPWAHLSGNLNSGPLGTAYRNLGAYGEGGFLGPNAGYSQMLEGAQGDADSLVRRQMKQSQISGLDPAQAAAYKQQALMQTGRGVQDIMAQTRAQLAARDADYARGLLGQLTQSQLGDSAAARDFNFAKNMPKP